MRLWVYSQYSFWSGWSEHWATRYERVGSQFTPLPRPWIFWKHSDWGFISKNCATLPNLRNGCLCAHEPRAQVISEFGMDPISHMSQARGWVVLDQEPQCEIVRGFFSCPRILFFSTNPFCGLGWSYFWRNCTKCWGRMFVTKKLQRFGRNPLWVWRLG